jgi:hypothetical protein
MPVIDYASTSSTIFVNLSLVRLNESNTGRLTRRTNCAAETYSQGGTRGRGVSRLT